ncbi:MAG: DUF4342 domain-containing protein [Peptoniphilaceae bacterium]
MISMEKIDYVINVTGASYDIVRLALLDSDGDVDLAIKSINSSISLFTSSENNENNGNTKKDFINFEDIKKAIKDIWEKGNASKLIVEKDGETVLSLSLTVSAIGVVLSPLAAILGFGIGLEKDYEFKIIMSNKEVIDLKEYIRSMKK